MPVSGAGGLKRITTNPGNDWGPVYSPNGMWIAYRAQMQPGEESDRWRLMLYARKSGNQSNLTENFDSSVESYAFAPDSKTIYFNAEDKGEMPIYSIASRAGKFAESGGETGISTTNSTSAKMDERSRLRARV